MCYMYMYMYIPQPVLGDCKSVTVVFSVFSKSVPYFLKLGVHDSTRDTFGLLCMIFVAPQLHNEFSSRAIT